MAKIKGKQKAPFFQWLSVKATLTLTVILICLCIIICSLGILGAMSSMNRAISKKHEQEVAISGGGGVSYSTVVTKEMPPAERFLYENTDFLAGVLILMVSVTCIALGVRQFYNIKIRKPLELLTGASENIMQNNLDFVMDISGSDELAALCVSFDRMRVSLGSTSRELWRSVEEGRRLRAAFAHDLRSPLTVLQGYRDFLEKGIAENIITEEKALEVLQVMRRQTTRLLGYVTGMNDMHSLEEITAEREPCMLDSFAAELRHTAEVLLPDKELRWQPPAENRQILLDRGMVCEVFENLIANAARYAATQVTVRFSLKGGELAVEVADDGPGFSDEGLVKASAPYYRQEPRGTEHFGLGLYISRILCDKHAGRLVLSNGKNGGAEIYAIFKVL